jgi:hypothetical protein
MDLFQLRSRWTTRPSEICALDLATREVVLLKLFKLLGRGRGGSVPAQAYVDVLFPVVKDLLRSQTLMVSS